MSQTNLKPSPIDEGGLRSVGFERLAEGLVVVRLHHLGKAGATAIRGRACRHRRWDHAMGRTRGVLRKVGAVLE